MKVSKGVGAFSTLSVYYNVSATLFLSLIMRLALALVKVANAKIVLETALDEFVLDSIFYLQPSEQVK